MIDQRLKKASDNVIELMEDGSAEQKRWLVERQKIFEQGLELKKSLKGVHPDAIEIALEYKSKEIRDELVAIQTALDLLPAFNRLNDDEMDELFEIWGVY